MKRWLFLVLLLVVLIGLPLEISCAGYRKTYQPANNRPPEILSDSAADGATFPVVNSPVLNPPNDPFFDKQWALAKMRIPQVWQITSGSPEIIVAILDTGIDQNHEDLKGKVVAVVNFSDSKTADDIYGHGTHLAGIIAAKVGNNLGVAGIAPNALLMNVKVAGDTGIFQEDALAKGIIWAVDNGAKVINIGLTSEQSFPALKKATDYAWEKGAIVVAAAGNFKGSKLIYPACYQNCLAVTSTDVDDSLSLWANRSDWVDVTAPGRDIYSTLPDNSYGYKSGDSFAVAQVSGIAALLFTVVTDKNNDGFLNDEVREILENNRNRIDAFEAVAQGASR